MLPRSNFLDYKKEGKTIQIKINNEILGDFVIDKNKGNFELDLVILTKHSRESKIYKKISSYPPVMRDLAIVLDKSIAYEKIAGVIKKSSALIQSSELFDVFTSEKIGQDKKSLAYHLIFQSDQKTLKSEEVDTEIKLILANLEKELGAQLRR